jgi:hypothetical protein
MGGRMTRRTVLVLGFLTACSGCEGTISLPPVGGITGAGGGGSSAIPGGVGGGGSPIPFVPPSTAALNGEAALGATPMQRLTLRQLLRTAESVFGVPAGAAAMLAPGDSPSTTWFDNDAAGMAFSPQLISAYEAFAQAYAGQVREAGNLGVLAGCTPQSPADAACFRKLVQRVGRRVFRRPLSAAEVQRHVDAFLPAAQADGNFGSAVELAVSAWLQSPEFLYRVEAGVPVAGKPTALSEFEVASRIAFLTTGVGPDNTLLDAAESGALAVPTVRSEQASRLLATAAAVDERRNFHAQWLGYNERFLAPALANDALAETAALVERVTGGNQDWLNLFSADETWVTSKLATHYGLAAPAGGSGWVKLPAGRAAGVLSQLTVASLGAKFGDTSPTLRGYELLKRVYCGKLTGEIPPGIDTNLQPGAATDCKPKRYTMRTLAACQQCHTVTDNIGFGLENVGADGQWRLQETVNPGCAITGEGVVNGSVFSGPQQLGALVANDPQVARCAATQLFQSFVGRQAAPADAATLDALQGQYYETRTHHSLVLSLVKSQAITFKGAN